MAFPFFKYYKIKIHRYYTYQVKKSQISLLDKLSGKEIDTKIYLINS